MLRSKPSEVVLKDSSFLSFSIMRHQGQLVCNHALCLQLPFLTPFCFFLLSTFYYTGLHKATFIHEFNVPGGHPCPLTCLPSLCSLRSFFPVFKPYSHLWFYIKSKTQTSEKLALFCFWDLINIIWLFLVLLIFLGWNALGTEEFESVIRYYVG